MKIHIFLITILYIQLSQQLDDNQAKFTSNTISTEPTNIDNIYILETAMDRFVIAIRINDQEQLLGILVNSTNPSWIFIDDGAMEHRICFQGVRNLQFAFQKMEQLQPQQPQQSNQQQMNKQSIQQQKQQEQEQKQEQNYCIDATQIKCTGNCQRINQLTQAQTNTLSNIKGKYRYNVTLVSQSKKIYKQFISASQYLVKLSSPEKQQKQKQKQDQEHRKKQISNDFVFEEDNFVRQEILNYYALITGEINMKELEYAVVQHSIGVSRYFMLHQLTSFSKFTPQEIISINSFEQTKISILYNQKQMHTVSIQPQFKFDSVMKAFSLPPTIIQHLRYYIFKQLLKQQKCQQINHEVNICANDRHQFLQKQNFSMCFAESKCLELNLGQVVEVEQQWSGTDAAELNYQYYLRIQPSESENIITLYPQFAAFYKILLKSGCIAGAIKYKSQQQKNSSELAERNISDHGHHQHIDEADKAKLNGSTTLYGKVAQQIIETYRKVSSLEYFFKVVVIFTCCLTSLCCYFRGLPRFFGWRGKDDEQTQLMDRQIQINERIEQSQNSLSSPSERNNINE